MLLSSFLFGIVSSLHCIGMCGPIAMMLPVAHQNPIKKVMQIMIYQVGRLTAYSLLGFTFGIFGRGFFMAGLQQQISILAGIFMLLFALVPDRVLARYNFSQPIFRFISNVKSSLGTQLKRKTPDALFSIGFLNGLLPCGLVYAALFGALAMETVLQSTVYMILFGLGTIPLMSLVVYGSSFMSVSLRSKLQYILPFVIIVMGILFILRGLGLGIAYVSPATTQLIVQVNPNCH